MSASTFNLHGLARTAGLLYLIVIAAGFFFLIYVPSHVIVHGNAHATVANIRAHDSLFRMGIAGAVVEHTAFLLLALSLYRLLSPVNRSAAVVMVALATMGIPIALSASAHQFDVLSLLQEPNFARAFTPDQLNARVMLSLASYGNLLLMSEIFWGLWLLPFGYLVFKSGFLPRILGVLLMLGCFSYLIDFLATCMQVSLPGWIILPASLGELGICLWLLVMGSGRQARHAAGERLAEAAE